VNELIINDPCVIFALSREAGPFIREFPPNQSFPGAPCRARFCGPAWLSVLVLETGPGLAATTKALDWLATEPLLENLRYRPKVILSAGFAGALQESHAVGDILLATEIVDHEGNGWPATWPDTLPPGEWRPPLHRGRILTAANLIASPEEKRSLAKRHDAAGVDMESAAVAQYSSRRGIPFGCVRAISDAATTALSPQLLQLLAGGQVAPLCVVSALVRRPWLARELMRLARDTRFAADQLAKALGELLTLTLNWSADI
jgi:adenosylhomocysteine nucleosidase